MSLPEAKYTFAEAETVEEAQAKAQLIIPSNVHIISTGITQPRRSVVSVDAYDEWSARLAAGKQKGSKVGVKMNVRLVSPGRKKFLGLGGQPNLYEVELLQPAIFAIQYSIGVRIAVIVSQKPVWIDSFKMDNWEAKALIRAYVPIDPDFADAGGGISLQEVKFDTISWKTDRTIVEFTGHGGGLDSEWEMVRTGPANWLTIYTRREYSD